MALAYLGSCLIAKEVLTRSHHIRGRTSPNVIEPTNRIAPRLLRNKRRDADNARALRKLGWRCVVIWECQAKNPAKLAAILRRRIPQLAG